jgi:hypothetical protein
VVGRATGGRRPAGELCRLASGLGWSGGLQWPRVRVGVEGSIEVVVAFRLAQRSHGLCPSRVGAAWADE